ncbi:MAG: response regulator [Gemmatirosa sp.]
MEDNLGDADLVIEYLRDVDAPGLTLTVRHVDRLASAIALFDRASDGARPDSLSGALFDALPDALPDVVLLDLMLPDSEGLETVRRLHAVAPLTPIVVLTGLAQQRVAFDAVQAGA